MMRKENKVLVKGITTVKTAKKSISLKSPKRSVNEAPVEILDPEISHWVKVIKASRASLTYERVE